jgi:hypothetical protein
MVLHEDFRDDFANEEDAIRDQLKSTPTDELRRAADEWRDAFDDVDDETVRHRAQGLNPSYDPTVKFGGYRQWAEWVREHLEAELAQRN